MSLINKSADCLPPNYHKTARMFPQICCTPQLNEYAGSKRASNYHVHCWLILRLTNPEPTYILVPGIYKSVKEIKTRQWVLVKDYLLLRKVYTRPIRTNPWHEKKSALFLDCITVSCMYCTGQGPMLPGWIHGSNTLMKVHKLFDKMPYCAQNEPHSYFTLSCHTIGITLIVVLGGPSRTVFLPNFPVPLYSVVQFYPSPNPTITWFGFSRLSFI